MTLLETERLARRLAEVLQHGDTPDLAAKLAGDYAAACHAANLRLQQCEAMIKAGDRLQAIQLAETVPNLLDLVTALEFRQADDWRAYCRQNALPAADPVDARAVAALNECYAQGITTDHPLYATFRKAVLHRNDEAALQALQSIVRLNPADTNAAAELVRLDAKVLTARLEHLGGMLPGGDPALMDATMETIEAFGFKAKPTGETWRKATVVRCAYLLDQAEQLKAAKQWPEALAKLEFIRRQQMDLKLELAPAEVRRLEALEAWTREEQARDRKEREFSTLLAELHFRIRQSEEKDTSARYVKLPELREDFEALHKVWRALADCTRPVPDEAAAGFRKRTALLEGEIARRTALRRRTLFTATAAALLVGGVLVWFVLGRMQAREFASQLQAAVSHRQARAAEHLLEQAKPGSKRLLNLEGVAAAVAGAESFVAQEKGLLENFNAALTKLPSRLDDTTDAGKIKDIADQLAATRTALEALAPDMKAENEPRVAAFERQWQQFLTERGTAVNGLLEQWIGGAEAQAAPLDYRAPVATATAQLATLAGTLKKIDNCEAGFTNRLSLRADLLQRAAAVRTKFAAYDRELKKLDDGLAALARARSFRDYSASINLMAASEFSGAPATVAATAMQSLGVSDESALRSLLGITNPVTWVFLKNNRGGRLMPEIAMPAERMTLQKLNTDPAINATHQHYRFWLDPDNTRSVEWITAGPLQKNEGWNQIPAWTPAATATTANFETRDYGYFGGQWKLSPTELVSRLESLGELSETAAFNQIGLGQVWSGGSTYAGPLLQVLDAVKDSHEGSPVFRAYLFCSLVDLMEMQPDAWGLSFCPAARADAAQIHALVGGPIASGDWFVPAKAQAWNVKLEQFFATRKPLSYLKQATGNLTLAQLTVHDGLHLVGYAGLDGQPVISETPPPAEVWGYDTTRKKPVRISGPVLPLSPLFALPFSRSDYFNKAEINLADPSFAEALPPGFRPESKP